MTTNYTPRRLTLAEFDQVDIAMDSQHTVNKKLSSTNHNGRQYKRNSVVPHDLLE